MTPIWVPFESMDLVAFLDKRLRGSIARSAMATLSGEATPRFSELWVSHEGALIVYAAYLNSYDGRDRTLQSLIHDSWPTFHESHSPVKLPSWWGGPVHSEHRTMLAARYGYNFEETHDSI